MNSSLFIKSPSIFQDPSSTNGHDVLRHKKITNNTIFYLFEKNSSCFARWEPPPEQWHIYQKVRIHLHPWIFTPLNISNGTQFSVPQDVKGQPLPINQLKGTPPMEECSISNVHRCIRFVSYSCNFQSNIIVSNNSTKMPSCNIQIRKRQF
jgi:hypothetical protein